MKSFIGLVLVIFSIIGFFVNITTEDLADSPARIQLLAFIFTLPWYAKALTLGLGVVLIFWDSNDSEE